MSPKNEKGFWIAVAILLVFGLVRVMTRDVGASEDVVGKKAPAFELESVSGDVVKLADMKGKVVLLDFWAVWCGPCRKSAPFFQELQDRYGKDGLAVVGVHVDDRMPSAEDVGEYLDDLGVSYTNVISTVDVDNEFMIFAMPTTYLIDREGVIVERHIGYDPATAPEEIEAHVRTLLGTK
jgi:thiol-disulfide isomerase/thioredoxin